MIDCSRCVRQKMKGSSSAQSQVRRNVYHNLRHYQYHHHNCTHCYSCSQSQLRRNVNLQLRSHQLHKQTGGCLQDLQTLFDQLTFIIISYLSTNCKKNVLVRNLRSFSMFIAYLQTLGPYFSMFQPSGVSKNIIFFKRQMVVISI